MDPIGHAKCSGIWCPLVLADNCMVWTGATSRVAKIWHVCDANSRPDQRRPTLGPGLFLSTSHLFVSSTLPSTGPIDGYPLSVKLDHRTTVSFNTMVKFTSVASLTAAVLAYAVSVFSAPTVGSQKLSKRAYTGQGTWFHPGLGNCGSTDSDDDWIVALDTKTYADGAHCDKSITITDQSSGNKATAKVRDSCPTCGTGSIDMSPSLFQQFESLGTGVVDVKWSFD